MRLDLVGLGRCDRSVCFFVNLRIPPECTPRESVLMSHVARCCAGMDSKEQRNALWQPSELSSSNAFSSRYVRYGNGRSLRSYRYLLLLAITVPPSKSKLASGARRAVAPSQKAALPSLTYMPAAIWRGSMHDSALYARSPAFVGCWTDAGLCCATYRHAAFRSMLPRYGTKASERAQIGKSTGGRHVGIVL